ncbi:Predicted N-acetyltransferase YhbS [Virgibacillus subterraneus]|uniref:Predicted N-acetyltransferase YhbS n=1 Tax=Virgibacillus subterraneus TaxID=621109 RepID=A0A1H9AMD3_9BACI|nr:GNAT family N-acetyltransferase [Virgibacillus subterraneus]SEP77543.1 Predicted N-acetyltransferase YhbS [Virgibacillus subterraneus]
MDIRHLKEQEFEQAIELSNQTFREKDHTSMGDAFPQVFSKQLNQSFAAFDGDQLVSFIGLVPSKMIIGNAALNTFSIGSVCTHSDYQGQGISTAILKKVYEFINQAGASLLFVSGDRGLYRRNDCYHFGKVYNYKIDNIPDEQNYKGSVRKGSATDLFQVDDLIKAKEVRYETNIWEWAMLLDAGGYASIFKQKQALYVAENHGTIEAYVVIGVPENESAIVTDWGGNPEAIRGILTELLANNVVPKIDLTVPWQDSLHDKLSDLPFKVEQNGGTVHIVNAERLIEQVMPYLMEKNLAVVEKLTITSKDGNVTLQYNESQVTLLPADLVKVLFDFQVNVELGNLKTLFPIPIPSTEGLYYV